MHVIYSTSKAECSLLIRLVNVFWGKTVFSLCSFCLDPISIINDPVISISFFEIQWKHSCTFTSLRVPTLHIQVMPKKPVVMWRLTKTVTQCPCLKLLTVSVTTLKRFWETNYFYNFGRSDSHSPLWLYSWFSLV